MKSYEDKTEWLFTSPNALDDVLQGIEDSYVGDVEPSDLDFTKYLSKKEREEDL